MVLKGLKSYNEKDTYIIYPVRSHGQNSEPKDNSNPAERKVSPEVWHQRLAVNIEDKIKEGQTQLDNREHLHTSWESYGGGNKPKSSTAY